MWARTRRSSKSAVTIPLEQSINGVEGMRYISSVSANDGTSAITVTFNTGYDLDIAAVDVQNRVSSASGRLPAAVNNTGITITKANSELCAGGRIHFAGPLAVEPVHFELYGCVCPGRAEAGAGCRRRARLRRAQVCDAGVAGPGEAGGARA